MIGTVLDPVCGMSIRLTDAIATATLEGRRFHFCHESCYEAFLDLPHSYVGWNDSQERRARRGRFHSFAQRVVTVDRTPRSTGGHRRG